uniref:60S ribosomal protein L27 n=1 Tax=Sexangularia sp. CB-2014 TaxID=1486929 RepID=A0A7S1Y969_9EUKA
MTKFIKAGKVVIVLKGRYAGKKAVVVAKKDDGHKGVKYPHAIIAGIEKEPRRVTRSMLKKQVKKRTKINAFVKRVNYNHIMPTRYQLDDIAPIVAEATKTGVLRDSTKRRLAEANIATAFGAKHKKGENPWFFEKLRF